MLGDEYCLSDLAMEYASGLNAEINHKLILFSGNDYLGLSSHPSVRRAASNVRLNAVIFSSTSYNVMCQAFYTKFS
jgi:7-keto-8-aminopelargonate synthetase-like enzyme